MTEARPALRPISWDREAVYRWMCGHDKCKASGRRQMRLASSMSASRHASRYEGHNVILSRLRPDGEWEFVKVILVQPKKVLLPGELPF